MKILVGKSKDEIKEDFCKKYSLPVSALDDFNKHMKKTIFISKDFFIIVGGILSILIGVSADVALIWELAEWLVSFYIFRLFNFWT
jgi:hypothetical protein